MRWTAVPSPIGDLDLAADEEGICRVHFAGSRGSGSPGSGSPGSGSPGSGSPGSGSPGSGLRGSGSPGSGPRAPGSSLAVEPSALLIRAGEQVREYFAGTRTGFDLPLSITVGSPFERAVWAVLAEIPYAEMLTYGEVAARTGDPGAARAVGVACNRNPLPILIPCHRVVGAGGKLVGFGGGLSRKRHLLELEARVRVERDFAG